MVDRTERRRLRHFPLFRCGRVLALGQPVDLVVEEEDLDVDVPAERVDQVVPTDRKAVAVTGDHPHRELRSGDRDPRGERGSAPVDPVHAVRVHVVREPAAAADPGHEHRLVRLDAELGHERLDR
jgi:hypothetical protein